MYFFNLGVKGLKHWPGRDAGHWANRVPRLFSLLHSKEPGYKVALVPVP